MIYKTFDIEIKEANENGGRIVISTGAEDRDKDHLMPFGARLENYRNNPVVQYGHNYHEPWATVGRTTNLEVSDSGIVADFELRPAANEHDPQNIVRLLWAGKWIGAASVGFNPIQIEDNDIGGKDYTEWDLLEWSLVPIPANQEALRLAAKAFEPAERESTAEPEREKEADEQPPELVQEPEPVQELVPELAQEPEPIEQEIEQPEATQAPEELDAPDEVPEELLDILADFVTEIEDHLRSD